MTRTRKIMIWVAIATVAGVVAFISGRPRTRQVAFLTGAVLRQDADPRKQQPIANARITTADGQAAASESSSSGLFRLKLRPGVSPGQAVTLRFRHPEYEPADVTLLAGDEIYIVRMAPIPREADPRPNGPEVTIANIRVRYAVKTITTANVGSAVRTFEVVNRGDVPCNGRPPCSPGGKWKAAIGSASFDAGDGNEFRNSRVSCIAGPCPFTRVESDNLSRGGRTVNVSVRNWSDTVTYLFEAEVTQTMASEMIRQSYPAIFGQAMNFTLPSTAQGPSIEAEVNGADIVFPLGPNLNLSWAGCSVKVGSDQTKAYRCELKPGYRFQ